MSDNAAAVAVSVRVGTADLRAVARELAADGVCYDSEDEELVCAACSRSLRPWQAAAHVRLPEHAAAVDAREGWDRGTPVTISGQQMLLDCSCVFPRTMFGAGRVLYDDTLHCLLLPDVTGAVELTPHHEYTVVEMLPTHDTTATLPNGPRRRMHYFTHNRSAVFDAGLVAEQGAALWVGVRRSAHVSAPARRLAAANGLPASAMVRRSAPSSSSRAAGSAKPSRATSTRAPSTGGGKKSR